MNNHKKVYFSGIGGIGVSALVRFYLKQGKQVLGSDLSSSTVTKGLEKQGVKIFYEQKAENITEDIDLLIYSAAVPETNPERQKAKELGILQKSYNEMLGELSKIKETIAITGTNGKSSTTALVAELMLKADLDPTVILGSMFTSLDNNFHYGSSEKLVLEACEYRAHFLTLDPKIIVLTNIEEDHLDYYQDLNHIIQTFQQFVNYLPEDGLLVVNQDDLNSQKLDLPDCKIITYGIKEESQVMAKNIKVTTGQQKFNLFFKGQYLGEVILKIPGLFNVYNALAAIALALSFNVSIESIKNSLANYGGIWRRFEVIKNEAYVLISDYGHHPTAVEETIKAAKSFYPNQRLVTVFQPHQHARTKKLFNDFVKSFSETDLLILSDIYDVKGRNDESSEISSQDLIKEVLNKGYLKEEQIIYGGDLEKTLDIINKNKKDDDVILLMGAGDIDTLRHKL